MKPGAYATTYWNNYSLYLTSRKGNNRPKPARRVVFVKGENCLLESQDGSLSVEKKETLRTEPQVLAGHVVVYRRENQRTVVALYPAGELPENAKVIHTYPFVCPQSKLENNQIDWYTEFSHRPIDPQ